MSEATRRADELLGLLAQAMAAHASLEDQAATEIEALRDQYKAELKQSSEVVKELEKALKNHAKRHLGEIFDGRDVVDLGNGRLLWSVSRVVKRARKVTVDTLRVLGFTDGIRTEERVDWDALETWPDERLVAAGTERVTKEEIGWELPEKE